LMEPDFDKEIDALLRKETAGRTITISEFAGGIHLDADEITAFAEKMVPPGVRDSFIEHFAACDRCRKVLLNAAWLNAEQEQDERAGVAAPVEIAVPWYRRLLLFPNLAYVMGGLVVLFAGFIGVSVIYNSFGGRSEQVSQVEYDQVPAASGPSAAAEPDYAANSNAAIMSDASANTSSNIAANMANTGAAANTAAFAANRAATQPPAADVSATPARLSEVARQRTEPTLTAAPPPPPKRDDSPATADGVSTLRPMQDRRMPAPAGEKENKVESQKSTPMSTPAPRAKTAAGNERRNAQAAEADLSMKKVQNLPVSPRGASTFSNRKQVSGRTFELRQGAWYDTSYRGQSTINVRRNTEMYRKLDQGLRGIAESLIGTIVTVWNGKAYRIQ